MIRQEIILICGRKGQGKTTWLKNYLIEHEHDYERMIVYDDRWSLNPQIDIDLDRLRIFDYSMMEKMNFAQYKNSLIAFDDMDVLLLTHSFREYFYRLFSLCRQNNNTLLATIKRPSNLPTDGRAIADRFIVFNMHLRNDLEWFENYDIEPERIRALRPLEFLEVTT